MSVPPRFPTRLIASWIVRVFSLSAFALVVLASGGSVAAQDAPESQRGSLAPAEPRQAEREIEGGDSALGSELRDQSPAEGDSNAVLVGADSFARSQVVALSRDLIVRGTVYNNASVLRGDAVVSGSIGGDLVVLEGSAFLKEGARVGGDVIVLGGSVSSEGDAAVEGRVLAYPNASRAILALIEVPTLGGRPVLLSAKIGLLLAWWVAGALLVACFPRQSLATSAVVAERPMASFFQGLTFILMGVLGFVLLAGLAPAMISLPLVVLVVLIAFALKIWGVIAVLLGVGRFSASRLKGRPADLLGQFLLGLVLVGAVKLLPWAGAIVWSSVTLVGMGAALRLALMRDPALR